VLGLGQLTPAGVSLRRAVDPRGEDTVSLRTIIKHAF
jgi:hypothetical protein